MNILVFGLGALGTVYATFLKSAGHTVYAITRERYLEEFRSRKVKVTGIWGEKEAVLDGIVTDVQALKHIPLDLVILTVKSYDTPAAVRQIRDITHGDTAVVVAQNGYGNYETVSGAIGKEQVLLARVIFGARVVDTGHSEVTVIADDVRVGQPEGAMAHEKIMRIVNAMKASGIPTSSADDVYALLWDKILYNCALNPLGALLECTYGALAEHAGTRWIMDGLMDEIFATADAHRIALRWKTPDQYRGHFYTNLVPPTRGHYPSMYYDLKAGKRTEIDALNGAVVGLAEMKNISVPLNQTITNLIKTREAMVQRG